MHCKSVRVVSLSFVSALFCCVVFSVTTGAQEDSQAWLTNEQVTAEKTVAERTAGGFLDNSSAFTRALAASEKRNQAQTQWLIFQRKEDDEALEKSLNYLAEAVALAPNSKSTWQLAARIHYALRNIPAFKLEAITSFEKLLRIDEQDLSSRVLLIDELISMWRWQQASMHLEAFFNVNQAIAVDTMLDRMVICYLKAGAHERGAAFLRQQISSADSKEPLIIALAIMEWRSGQTDAALANLGKVLFSNGASKAVREKARQLKTYWQENEWVLTQEASE